MWVEALLPGEGGRETEGQAGREMKFPFKDEWGNVEYEVRKEGLGLFIELSDLQNIFKCHWECGRRERGCH